MAREWGSSFIAASQEALSTSAEEVVAARPSQIHATIKNTDESITVYLGEDNTVSSTTGFPLLAGESIEVYTRAAIWMIAASGTPTVAILEEYD